MTRDVTRTGIRYRVSLCASLLMLPFVLLAGHQASSFSALMYNDSVTLGLAENQDDLRSFGMDFGYTHESGWFGQMDVSGITRRSRTNEDVGTRYDELVIQGGKLFHFHIGETMPHMSVKLSPLFGFVIAGNMGFNEVQNIVHDVFSLDEVILPYETDTVAVYPRLGFDQSFDYIEPASWFTVSELVFRTEVEGLFMPGYAGSFYLGASVGHQTVSSSEFLVGMGYAWIHVLDDWSSHERVGFAETGLKAYVKGHFGLLAFSYQWYLNSLQGYGGMGFDIAFGRKALWKRNDLLLSLGMMLPQGMLSTSLRYRVRNNIGVVVGNVFKMIPLEDELRVRENTSSWHVGVDYEFSMLDVGVMRPFAMVSMGVRRFLVMRDADPAEPEVLDSNGRIRVSEAIRFSMDGAVGMRFFPQGQLQYDGVAYGLEVSGGLMFADSANLVSSYEMFLIDMWLPYVRIALTVGSHL